MSEALVRAGGAGVAVADLIGAEEAIDAKLDAIAELEGDDVIHAIRDRIEALRYEPAFAFVSATAYAAGRKK